MAKVMISPGKYVQGKGVLKEIEEYLESLGDSFLIIVDPELKEILNEDMEKGFKNLKTFYEPFNGECTKNEIERLKKIVEKEDLNGVIGAGGGKTLDTAKAVGYYSDIPVTVVPTIAATDAPCSALSVIYNEEGVFEEYLLLPSNPDLVLVDTGVIAKAPVRFIVSGMGDALATYFEADAAAKTMAPNMAGGEQTLAALALAGLSYDILLEYGLAARQSVEANVVSPALEKIVEANTLLSGLGFESGGLAAAHAIHNGFTVLEETHNCTHGEKVAFSTIVQLVMEDRPIDIIEEVIYFCKSVGLPTTLKDLGLDTYTEDDIYKVAKASCAEDETIHNMPFKVDEEMLKDAIIAADRMSQIY